MIIDHTCSLFLFRLYVGLFDEPGKIRGGLTMVNVNAVIQDSLAGIRVVKSFANEEVEKTKFEKGNKEFLETKQDSYFIMGRYYCGNSLFQGLLYLLFILAGGGRYEYQFLVCLEFFPHFAVPSIKYCFPPNTILLSSYLRTAFW